MATSCDELAGGPRTERRRSGNRSRHHQFGLLAGRLGQMRRPTLGVGHHRRLHTADLHDVTLRLTSAERLHALRRGDDPAEEILDNRDLQLLAAEQFDIKNVTLGTHTVEEIVGHRAANGADILAGRILDIRPPGLLARRVDLPEARRLVDAELRRHARLRPPHSQSRR